MITDQVPTPPVLACAQRLEATLLAAGDLQPTYLTTAEKREALTTLARVRTEVDELLLRVLAASDDVADLAGFRNAGTWLAHATHDNPATGHGDFRLAKALDTKYTPVAEAMRAGVVNRSQAQVIVTALDKLPPEVEAFARKKAERHLVELAGDFGPRELRQLGDHLLEVIAPEAAEELDAKALEREEQRARQKTSLRVRGLGGGMTRVIFDGPDASAARLVTYLDAYTSPRRGGFDTASPGGSAYSTTEGGPRHQRLGHAFTALLEHLDPKKLPQHGGDATTLVVMIDHDKLTKDLATAGILGGLDGDLRISASEARRLACNANILPAVLNGKGEILDLGRSQRLYNAAQHRAMRIRDKRCRVEGCGIPAAWCEAHHEKPWSEGGRTDVKDGRSLCSFHHHLAHDTRFTHETLPNGDWRFHRTT